MVVSPIKSAFIDPNNCLECVFEVCYHTFSFVTYSIRNYSPQPHTCLLNYGICLEIQSYKLRLHRIKVIVIGKVTITIYLYVSR